MNEQSLVSYDYKTERASLFTEDGVACLRKIEARVDYLLKEAGAFNAMAAWKDCSGCTWQMQAALEYLCEQRKIECVDKNRWMQYWIYTGPFAP